MLAEIMMVSIFLASSFYFLRKSFYRWSTERENKCGNYAGCSCSRAADVGKIADK